MYNNMLVVGSEIHSSGLDFTDRGRAVSVIFGDGAGAVVLTPSDTGRHTAYYLRTCTPTANWPKSWPVLLPTSNKKERLTKEMIDDGSIYPS